MIFHVAFNTFRPAAIRLSSFSRFLHVSTPLSLLFEKELSQYSRERKPFLQARNPPPTRATVR